MKSEMRLSANSDREPMHALSQGLSDRETAAITIDPNGF